MFSNLTCAVSHSPVVLDHMFLVAFPPGTPSKSVHRAVGVTSKTQSKVKHNARPNVDRKTLLVAVNRLRMRFASGQT